MRRARNRRKSIIRKKEEHLDKWTRSRDSRKFAQFSVRKLDPLKTTGVKFGSEQKKKRRKKTTDKAHYHLGICVRVRIPDTRKKEFSFADRQSVISFYCFESRACCIDTEHDRTLRVEKGKNESTNCHRDYYFSSFSRLHSQFQPIAYSAFVFIFNTAICN